MAGFDWDAFGKDAEKIAFANKVKDASTSSGPATLDVGGGSVPEYQAPKLLGQQDATAAQELQAANQVASAIPEQTVTPQAPAPKPMTQPQAQPGMIPVQQTVSQTVTDPLARSEQRIAGMAVDEALQSKANAEIAANNAAQEEARARAALLQKEADETAAANAKRAEEANQKRAAIESAVQERDSFKFNPNRHKERMGVGGQILATIGEALGAFGAALTKTPNYAHELLQRAIDNDVHSQEKEYAALGAKVDSRRNDFAAFRQQGFDDDAARTASRLLRLQQASAKYDELAAGTKNAQTLATIEQLRALNQQTQANTAAEYSKRQINTTNAAISTAPQGTENQLRQRALEVDVPQYDPKDPKKRTGTRTLMAKSSADAEKIRDAMTVKEAMKANIEKLRSFMGKTSVHSVGSNAAVIETAADDLRTQFAVLKRLGALSDKDYKIASQIGDPASLFQRDSTTFKLMDEFGGRIDSEVESQLRGRGLIQ